MDTFLSVLATLGVNETLWIQFIISIIFLVLARLVFVNDLLRVLTNRVINTTGATDEAEKLKNEAENAKKRYEKLLNEKVLDLHNSYSTNRKKLKDEIDTEYKTKEEKIINNFKSQIEMKQMEFSKAQQSVESRCLDLSTELLAKIIK